MKKFLLMLLALSSLSMAYAAYTTYDEANKAGDRHYYQDKNVAAARGDWQQALALAKTPQQKAETLISIGQSYYDEGQHEEARATWRKALDIPDGGQINAAHIGIAGSYFKEHQFALARAEFLKILASDDKTIDPDMRVGRHNLIGTTYQEEKNFAQARLEYQTVLADDNATLNTKILAQTLITQTYIDAGDYVQGRAEAAKLLAQQAALGASAEDRETLHAGQTQAQLDIGRTYFLEKNFAQAKIEYEKALQMQPLRSGIQAEAEKQLKAIAELQATATKQ